MPKEIHIVLNRNFNQAMLKNVENTEISNKLVTQTLEDAEFSEVL